MVRILKKSIVFLILCFYCISLCGSLSVFAGEGKDAVDEVNDIIDGIISFNAGGSSISDVQGFIDKELTGKIGGVAEWYVLGLSQYGEYDLSKYREALEEYLKENDVKGASARLKFSLLLKYAGGNEDYILKCLNDGSVGGQGIMSYVFGLHLYNNGCVGQVSKADIVDRLKELRHEDGGWSVTGNVGDVDVTAMTLTALAPLKDEDAVKELVDGAVDFLSGRQLEDGDFSSFGVRNAESTAQVITALSALGIDCASDQRFIKNGRSVLDGLSIYRLEDGSFSHKEEGGSNPSATVQSFYSLVAYLRMKANLTPLYILDPGEMKLTAVYAGNKENGSEDGEHVSVGEEKGNSVSEEDTARDTEGYGTKKDNENFRENVKDSQNNAESGTGLTDRTGSSRTTYKIYAIICVLVLCAFVSVVFLIKKKHWKNHVFTGVLGAAAVLFIIFTDFSSHGDYYGKDTVKTDVTGKVSMSIRCDILKGKITNEHIPEDFCILDMTDFEIQEGETVYDILLEAAKKYSISVEHEGTSEIVYISGINYLYENDFGDLSGWVYKVNGDLPSVGCGGYTLKPGDRIEWCYTLDLGNDVK